MKTKLLLFLFTFAVTTTNLRATGFTVDGIAYTIASAASPYTVAVAQKSPIYTGVVTIPASVSYNSISYSVTSIGSSAFYNCTGLTSVTIPNSVTSIANGAFAFCTGLSSITIPNSVTSIGYSAFNSCTGLTSITIPSSVTSIGEIAFTNDGSFYVDSNNPNYSSIEGVLYNKAQTTLIQCGVTKKGSFVIPSSVTYIGRNAFNNCTGLTFVTIPNSVTSFGVSVFYGCSGLTSITIPSSITSIEMWTFQKCTGLTSVNLPNSVTSIGVSAFESCTGLTSITIPNSVTTIGVWAFQKCTGLTSVTIPNSVTSIGNQAFSGCSGLFYVDANNPNYSSINGVLYNKDQTTLIQCPISKIGSFVIPLSVNSIAEYAFYGCIGLTLITIPNSVTSIGDEAFYNCTSLTSVTIPNSVTSIGPNAFYGCKGLTSINADSPTPVNLSSSYYVFNSVNKTTCTLYVPIGSKSLYAVAPVWKDFTNIVEHIVTGIATVTSNKLNIRVIGHKVEIDLPEASATVQVVDINGRHLYFGTPSGSTLSVTLPQAGVYLVRVGNKTGKLVVK